MDVLLVPAVILAAFVLLVLPKTLETLVMSVPLVLILQLAQRPVLLVVIKNGLQLDLRAVHLA